MKTELLAVTFIIGVLASVKGEEALFRRNPQANQQQLSARRTDPKPAEPVEDERIYQFMFPDELEYLLAESAKESKNEIETPIVDWIATEEDLLQGEPDQEFHILPHPFPVVQPANKDSPVDTPVDGGNNNNVNEDILSQQRIEGWYQVDESDDAWLHQQEIIDVDHVEPKQQ